MDATLATSAHQAAPATSAAVNGLRAARPDEITMLHGRLIEAVRTSPFYGDEFKAYETARLTPGYLEALQAADPWHVATVVLKDQPAGFMISGPELGTLWLYWSYIFPEARRSSGALLAMRGFVEHWDNGRFHKIATYTKTGNDAAEAIMLRFGFNRTALLEQHIFGEDYLLYERKLNKVVPGYDHGAQTGRMAQLRRRVGKLLGR